MHQLAVLNHCGVTGSPNRLGGLAVVFLGVGDW